MSGEAGPPVKRWKQELLSFLPTRSTTNRGNFDITGLMQMSVIGGLVCGHNGSNLLH